MPHALGRASISARCWETDGLAGLPAIAPVSAVASSRHPCGWRHRGPRFRCRARRRHAPWSPGRRRRRHAPRCVSPRGNRLMRLQGRPRIAGNMAASTPVCGPNATKPPAGDSTARPAPRQADIAHYHHYVAIVIYVRLASHVWVAAVRRVVTLSGTNPSAALLLNPTRTPT